MTHNLISTIVKLTKDNIDRVVLACSSRDAFGDVTNSKKSNGFFLLQYRKRSSFHEHKHLVEHLETVNLFQLYGVFALHVETWESDVGDYITLLVYNEPTNCELLWINHTHLPSRQTFLIQ